MYKDIDKEIQIEEMQTQSNWEATMQAMLALTPGEVAQKATWLPVEVDNDNGKSESYVLRA